MARRSCSGSALVAAQPSLAAQPPDRRIAWPRSTNAPSSRRRSARPVPRRGGAKSWPPARSSASPNCPGSGGAAISGADDREAQPRPSITLGRIDNRLQCGSRMRPHRRCGLLESRLWTLVVPAVYGHVLRVISQPRASIAAVCPRRERHRAEAHQQPHQPVCRRPAKRAISSPGNPPGHTGGMKRAHVARHNGVSGNCSIHQACQRCSV